MHLVFRYRLLRTPPFEFTLLRDQWRIELHEIGHAGTWRCSAFGPGEWAIAHAATRDQLLAAMMETGVEISARSFVGTLFLRLETSGLAARLE